jgi:hypothetical protein
MSETPAEVLKPGSKCPCGQALPWHLIELALPGFKHVCSCERLYEPVEGGVHCTGTEKNPFAAMPP